MSDWEAVPQTSDPKPIVEGTYDDLTGILTAHGLIPETTWHNYGTPFQPQDPED